MAEFWVYMGLLLVYLIQRTQGMLPLNPLKLPGVDGFCAFNTACSFASNTNWQSYWGETTMSWAAQMLAAPLGDFRSPLQRGQFVGNQLRNPRTQAGNADHTISQRGSGRPALRLRQWTRPPHHSRGRPLPGSARGQGAQSERVSNR